MTGVRVTSTTFSEIPFCNTFTGVVSAKGVLLVPGAVLGAALGVRADFLIGETVLPGNLPGDFPSDKRFAAVLPRGVEGLLPVLDDDSDNVPVALEREISLLTESLLCLSVNGDLAASVLAELSRGLVAPAAEVAGAVFGLDDAPVASCFVMDVLTVVPADVGLGFDVTLDVVDVFAVVDGNGLADSVVFVVVVVVFAVAGLAATLPTCFVSPRFVVDFFSDVAVLLDEELMAVLGLDLVVLARGKILVLVAVVVVVVALDNVVVLVPVTLLLVLEIALVDPSTSCLGRAATDFFEASCDEDDVVTRAVVVLATLEGDVGVIFVAVFVAVTFVAVVVVFVGRFAVTFTFVVPTVLVATAVSVICSFNSVTFAFSSGNAFAVSGSVSSSFFVGIYSGVTCFVDITKGARMGSFSTSFCSVGAIVNNV